MVSGYHHSANAGASAFEHGLRRTLSGRVEHTAKAEQGKPAFAYFSAGIILVPQREHAQSAGRHKRKLLPAGLEHRGNFPVLIFVKAVLAKGQKHVRRAFYENKAAAAAAFHPNGHKLPRRGEGNFRRSAKGCRLFDYAFFGFEHHFEQRRFRRFAADFAVLILLRIGAKCGAEQQLFRQHAGPCKRPAGKGLPIGQKNLRNGHFVLRQRAGFVGADYVRAAESFHRVQPPYQRVLFEHPRNRKPQRNCYNRGQPLRNCRNGEGKPGEEHIKRRFAA